SRCLQSLVSHPIWRGCRQAAPFTRVARMRCRDASKRSRRSGWSVSSGGRDAGSPIRSRQRRLMPAPLLGLRDLQNYCPARTGSVLQRKIGWVKAVDGVDLAIFPGETLGLIGESGCGKTTTSKLILLQESPTAGTIRFDGEDVSALRGQDLMRYRREV